MHRFLIATQPITGHVLPALPIAQALVRRGHAVMWYVGAKFRRQVEATGAEFAPYAAAYDYDDDDYDAAFPGRSQLKGLDQIKFDFVNLFMKQISAQSQDIEDILKSFPADVTLGDPSMFATQAVHERGGPPPAIYNITCLGLKSQDTAPFGLGMWPDASALGRLRNRILYFMAANVIFKAVSDELGRQCDALKVRRRTFEGPLVSPFLTLQPSVPEFEYPRSDLPPQILFIGPLLPEAPSQFTPPAWWGEVTAKRRPVVLVTQGTVATNVREMVTPTLQALAQEDVLVIAAGVRDSQTLGLGTLPANARVERFVPFKALMPYVDVYVTNGGFGGVHYALAHGIPIVAGGTTEDKPEIANRVAYNGVGINLKTNAPTPDQVRTAVKTILADGRYAETAKRIQASMAHHDAPTEAATLLEELASTRRPVVASPAQRP